MDNKQLLKTVNLNTNKCLINYIRYTIKCLTLFTNNSEVTVPLLSSQSKQVPHFDKLGKVNNNKIRKQKEKKILATIIDQDGFLGDLCI